VKFRLILLVFVLSLILAKSYAQTTRPPIPLMGTKMLKDFFLYHLIYPESSLNNNEEGIVEIAFSTDINGNVLYSEIISSVSPEIDKEALRLFNLIIWQPALKYGIKVEGEDVLNVNFNKRKYKKVIKRRDYADIIRNYTVDTSYAIYNEKVLDSIAKPILPDGCSILYDYVYKQMKYPPQAVKLEIQGKVEICFIIETNGLPSNFVINQSIGGGCTGEALRIVRDLKWQAGFKDKLAVRSRKIMFIEFRLSSVKSGKHIPNQSNSGL